MWVCIYHTRLGETRSVSTKSPIFHGSSTVYISMKAVNQLGRWLGEIKGLPTESQDGQFQYLYTLIYE